MFFAGVVSLAIHCVIIIYPFIAWFVISHSPRSGCGKCMFKCHRAIIMESCYQDGKKGCCHKCIDKNLEVEQEYESNKKLLADKA